MVPSEAEPEAEVGGFDAAAEAEADVDAACEGAAWEGAGLATLILIDCGCAAFVYPVPYAFV